MAELTPDIAAEVVAACRAGAEEAAAALSRSLGSEFQLSVGEAAQYRAGEQISAAGLVVSLTFGDTGAAMVLPESTGLVPAWCTSPDATGESELGTLAQELSRLLLPESLTADESSAGRVENLAQALTSAEIAADAVLVPLELSSGGKQGTMSLLWPLARPGELLSKPASAGPDPAPAGEAAKTAGPTAGDHAANLGKLPAYTRSLLKIPVPVAVCLAAKKQPVKEIVELGVGSLINFDKPCDELLELAVGNRPIADGEVVKVGDKFGLRINALHLPQEHFKSVRTTSPTGPRPEATG